MTMETVSNNNQEVYTLYTGAVLASLMPLGPTHVAENAV